ncbi:hypothetical protein [Bacillus cereus]|uniref:hypothetical protein n=1 Tax=Bacillus cereus TaxID=1396 RepID=UPI0020C17A5D|nr:hypothetical protein [Bacillus cereus]
MSINVFNRTPLFAGGYPVLTEEHCSDINAHPNLVRMYGYKTTQTDAETKNSWTKIANVSLTERYKYALAHVQLMSGSHGYDYSQHCLAYIRVKQQSSMGSPPVIQLLINNYALMSPEHFKAVLVKNDSKETRVDIYVNVVDSFDYLSFSPLHISMNDTGSKIEWFSNQPLLGTLPPGSLTDALEDITYIYSRHLSSQTMQVGWNKLKFQTRINDFRGEYDAVTSKIRVKQGGVYAISVAIRLNNPPTNQRSLGVYVNGVLTDRFGNSSGAILTGNTFVKVNGYDVIEVYMNTPDAVTVEGSTTDTYIKVKK